MKRYFTFLIILLILFSAAAVNASDVSYELEGAIEVVPKGDGASNFVSTHGGEYAILTPVIPEGKVLYELNVLGSPTWANQNGNSNAEIDVYKWLGDFDISMDSRSLYHETVVDHQDCHDLVITFGPTALRYGYRYLIVFHAYDGSIGYWNASGYPEGWDFYGNLGSKIKVAPWIAVTYAKVGDLGPEPTDEPEPPITPLPVTEAPETTETGETAAPTADEIQTGTPAVTEEIIKAADSEGSDNLLPVSILCLSGAICLAAVVLMITKKK